MTTLADACKHRSRALRKIRKLHAIVDLLPVLDQSNADEERRSRALLARQYGPFFDDPKLHVEDRGESADGLRSFAAYLVKVGEKHWDLARWAGTALAHLICWALLVGLGLGIVLGDVAASNVSPDVRAMIILAGTAATLLLSRMAALRSTGSSLRDAQPAEGSSTQGPSSVSLPRRRNRFSSMLGDLIKLAVFFYLLMWAFALWIAK